ncbi:hypothetical protein PV325_005682 [Microctonus aethiopoides]|nr:hypothetical protein PV325_005682 [Microctonus aethiopoides]
MNFIDLCSTTPLANFLMHSTKFHAVLSQAITIVRPQCFTSCNKPKSWEFHEYPRKVFNDPRTQGCKEGSKIGSMKGSKDPRKDPRIQEKIQGSKKGYKDSR